MADPETTKPEPTQKEISEKAAAFDVLLTLLRQAYNEYRKPGRQDKRAASALRALGFNTGKREPEYDAFHIYREYLSLILGKIDWNTFTLSPPMDRWDAINTLTEKHDFASAEACRQFLKRIHSETYQDKKRGIIPPLKV